MEQYFAVMFEDVRHERSLLFLLSLTDRDILSQSKFTDYEIDFTRKFSFRETTLTAYFERTRSHVIIKITIRIIFFCLINEYIYKFKK